MKELYSRIDKDNSGTLELKEVLLFMKALTDDLSEENITAIFQNLDMDQSDSIDFDEFMVDTTMIPDLSLLIVDELLEIV